MVRENRDSLDILFCEKNKSLEDVKVKRSAYKEPFEELGRNYLKIAKDGTN